MSAEQLPPELILAIQRGLETEETPETDPLDVLSPNFNPVDVLNAFFPDEESLGQISSVQANLTETERQLQTEIVALQAELIRDQDPNRMQLIQEMISDLLGQMSRIREKATESEAVVRNITKDIQTLDRAKRNLISSMTTLKRLQMLVNALTQLEDLVKEKKYGGIAQTLSAVKQLAASFKPYMSVQRISQVWKRVNSIQGDIRTQLDAEFDTYYQRDPSRPVKPSTIAEACLVVDVLGPEARTQVIERYVALELREYRRIFRVSDEAGQLDNISRRFAWFRRMLGEYENEQGRVFPAEWRVPWALLAKFTDITREDLASLLSKSKTSLTVKVYLDNLQIVTDFESALAKKYATPFHDIVNAPALNAPPGHTTKTITSAFEPHMNVFVDAQDKAISDLIAPHRKAQLKTVPRSSLEASASGSEGGSENESLVLPSSTELFYFYGQSLDQCSKLATGKGRGLYSLCQVCKKWLKVYAEDVLTAGLKKPTSTSVTRRSMESRHDTGDIDRACLILNTADYCQTTADELEENLRNKIDASLKEKVTLQEERDVFVGVISTALAQLLQYLDNAVDQIFLTLSKMSWPTQQLVSGQSPYVAELIRATESFMEAVKDKIEGKKYWRNFCDKVCSALLAKFTAAMVKGRPLGEIGAEQLLIDLPVLRAFLLRLPGEPTAMYTKSVTKSITRLETLLKVVVTPTDPYEGFILNYTLLIGDASFSNFQKALDLKGTPKAEQTALLDSFLTITSTKTDLESTSFLSSLDMDPGSVQSSASLLSPTSSRASLVDGVFAGLGSPPTSRPSTTTPDSSGEQKQREVFSDLRRLVSFGLRRDSQMA